MTITESPLTVNLFSRPGRLISPPRALVMHWTGVPGQPAEVVRDFFESRKDGRSGYGSAHYIVGLDGAIVRCIPESEVAYHVGSSRPDPASGQIYTDWARAHFGEVICNPATIGPNACTLGIELCTLDAEGNFTPATLAAAQELAADVCRRHELDPYDDVTTHHAIVGWKDCPRLWVSHPELLEAFRIAVKGRVP